MFSDELKENAEVKEEVTESKEEEKPQELEEVQEAQGASVKLTTSLDYRTMKYLNIYLLKYKRKTFLLYGILIVLSIAAAVYLGISSKGKDYIWIILFGLVILYTCYQAFSMERNLDKHLKNFFTTHKPIDQTYTVSSENIKLSVSTDPTREDTFDWAYISEIAEIPQYYFLFISGSTPMVFDKNNIIEGSLEELEEIIKEKTALKPYKKLDKEIIKKPITFVQPEIFEATKEEQKDAVDVQVEEVKPEEKSNDEDK